MSTLNYTLIDADPSAGRDDDNIEADPGVSPGNALQVYQFDSIASQEYELVRTTAGAEPEGTGEGLIMIGAPGNIPWVDLDGDGDTPTGSGSEQRVNVDGAIRSRGYFDELGRDVVGLLDNLLPAAPNLQTFDAPDTGNASSGSGKIGTDAPSFLSQNAVVSVDPDKTADPSERGVIDGDGGVTFTGDLNFDVSGTDIYSDDAFGPGDKGHLEIVVNGNRPTGTEDGDNTNDDSRYFDLTDLSAQDTTSTGSATGFDMDAAQTVTFSNGETFGDGYERTGEYYLRFADNVFVDDDVNEVEVRHYVGGSVRASTNTIRFFLDTDSSNITFNTTNSGGDPAIDSLTLNDIGEANGGKSLSGIKYAAGADAALNYVVGNVYRTSYSNDSNGIDYVSVQNCAVDSAQIPDNSSVDDDLLIADQIPGTGEVQPGNDGVYKIRAGDDAQGFGDGPDVVTAGDFQIQLQVNDPVEGAQSAATATGGYNLLVDNDGNQPNWETQENFIIEGESQHTSGGEGTRVQEANVTFGGDVSDGNLNANARYDPTTDISDDSADADYTNELQVYDRQLIYPDTNFASGFNPTTASGNYSGSNTTGQRQYVGFAEDKSSNTKDFAVAVNASQSNLVQAGTLTNGTSDVSLELRIGGTNDTGWLDVTVAEDQSGGCFASVNGTSQSLDGNDIGIIMDAFSGSSGAGGRLFYRFTYPENGTAVIDNVNVTYSP